jgi:biopolymer transport protein ExbD
MRLQRSNKLLIEPPSCATGDIAFNLIVFFLVCASTEPDSGRRQEIPRSDQQQQQQEKNQNIEVYLERTTVSINGQKTKQADFLSQVKRLLAGKTTPEEKVVVVKSTKDTSYEHWIAVTSMITEAGGTVTLQLEEEQTVVTGN